jgi:hypothetical protein
METLIQAARRDPDLVAVLALCLVLGLGGAWVPDQIQIAATRVRIGLDWTEPVRTALDQVEDSLNGLAPSVGDARDALRALPCF